ncbi:hypothetical protein [Streptomyces sp. NPDC004134]|uniref:hypothetical protein n=1 Tax=Streptomyces sp. NPDC004134 TaxID=3364691 RepID=UPI0036763307
MRTRISLAVAAAGLALGLTACGSSDAGDGNVADCKSAIAEQMQAAADTDAEGHRPAACIGIDDKTLQRIAGELLEDELGEFEKELEEAEVIR